MKIGKYIYHRVARNMPCPLCERKKYCLVSEDGEYVICTSVQSQKYWETYNGWLHKLNKKIDKKKIVKTKTYKPNQEYIEKLFYGKYIYDKTAQNLLATELGLPEEALNIFGVKTADCHYGIPMRNEKYQIIGIMKRDLGGNKWCEKHSRLGLFLPSIFDIKNEVFVCEGVTDAMALKSKGYNTIARPSATACDDMVVKLTARNKYAYIMADNDTIGIKGAISLAQQLWIKSKIIIVPKYKDTRAWINSGTFKNKDINKYMK